MDFISEPDGVFLFCGKRLVGRLFPTFAEPRAKAVDAARSLCACVNALAGRDPSQLAALEAIACQMVDCEHVTVNQQNRPVPCGRCCPCQLRAALAAFRNATDGGA